MTANVMIPAWLVAPVAILAMLILAGHIGFTERHTRPPSRRRIRIANGWIMLITTPLIAAGVGVLSPSAHPRAFALTWMAVVALVGVSVVLAIADVANTIRLARRGRRRSRRALSHARLRASLEALASREGGAASDE